MSFVSRGFHGRRRSDVDSSRIPPGQYLTPDFPVLSAGPTPHRSLELWNFSIIGEVDEPRGWTWEEFRALPSEEITRDIHCVTKWSKLDTVWRGVSVDTLLEGIETSAEYVIQYSDGGYTTNLPLADVTGGKAWVVYEYDGEPLAPEHGGPVRMLVPHLYFWKSAKWLRGLRLQAGNSPTSSR
jgi:DMSO/TMAO reductase YedYZ molybdopterin-dependent catalytic subunit